jgi:ribonuclease HI
MTTVFQAEIYAIGQAALHIHNHPEILANGIEHIDIVTDSKSALCALDSMYTKSKIVGDCMRMLDRLQTRAKVIIHWIKAHVGHEGNEKADELAKIGTQKPSYSVEPILPVPLSWIKNKIRAYQYNEWTNRWQSINEARQTKIFFPKPNPKLSKQLLSYDKTTCATLFRWISGHSFHRYHNSITTPNTFTDSFCRACNQARVETNHLFAHCTGLMPQRMKVCGQPTLPENFSWSPSMLLAMIKEIEKVCPEEGQIDTQTAEADNITNGDITQTMAE